MISCSAYPVNSSLASLFHVLSVMLCNNGRTVLIVRLLQTGTIRLLDSL